MTKRTGIIILIIVFAFAAVWGIYFLITPSADGELNNPDDLDKPEITEPLPPSEIEDKKQSVVVYIPDEQAETLMPVGAEAEDDSDAALIQALIHMGALPAGCEINSSKIEDTVLKLDMNMIYGNAVRSAGTAGENMLIYTVVNTFIQASGAEKVLITVEGDPLETGHNIYDYPLEIGYTQ